jgi:hypothetical protein
MALLRVGDHFANAGLDERMTLPACSNRSIIPKLHGKEIVMKLARRTFLELAASARKRGAEVTVIEAQPRILMRGVPEAHTLDDAETLCLFPFKCDQSLEILS